MHIAAFFSRFSGQRFNVAIGNPQAMVPIDRLAPVAPMAGPAGCSEAASSGAQNGVTPLYLGAQNGVTPLYL